MLKSALIGIALVVCATPVLAFNGPDDSPNPSRTAPLPDGVSAYPANSPCHKAKAPLTPEQRAQKKAMREQRAAERAMQGLPAKAPRDHGARAPRNRAC